jgi:hypothetical protein
MSITTFIDKRNQPIGQHVELKPFESSFRVDQSRVDTALHNITRRVIAQVVDMQETAIVDAVIECARATHVDDIYLLDKKFVLDALCEKMERDCPVRRRPYIKLEENI